MRWTGTLACSLLLGLMPALLWGQGPEMIMPYGQQPTRAELPPPDWGAGAPGAWAPPPGAWAPPDGWAGPPTELVPNAALVVPPPAPPPKIWEGSFELGLNGTEGNSDTFNFRLGANGKRKTADNELTLSLIYNKSSAFGAETANRAFFEGRNEWLFDKSPWTLFIHGTMEYDEFKAFDLRHSTDAGVGYNFIKNDCTTLVGRLGPGVSHEIGGPDDSFVPEAVLGVEFDHKFSERQKVLAAATYYPALDDFGDYRLTSKAGWELLIDPEWNLSLQLSVSDRYDSTPNGAKPNDLDYGLLLIWKF